MGRITAFFSKLDATIQRRFDSVCFFLMRRFGVRKSTIRYAISAAVIIALVGDLAGRMHYSIASFLDIFVGGFIVIIMLLIQHRDAIADREAETRPGTASKADRRSDGGVWKIVSLIFFSFDVLRLAYPPQTFVEAGLTEGQHIFPTFCSALGWLFLLAWMYIGKTPMNPPAEKAREHVGTPQTAPAKT